MDMQDKIEKIQPEYLERMYVEHIPRASTERKKIVVDVVKSTRGLIGQEAHMRTYPLKTGLL